MVVMRSLLTIKELINSVARNSLLWCQLLLSLGRYKIKCEKYHLHNMQRHIVIKQEEKGEYNTCSRT